MLHYAKDRPNPNRILNLHLFFFPILVVIILSFQYSAIASMEQIFTDVTESAGVQFEHTDGRSGLRLFNEFLGSGGGFFRL